MQNTNYIIDWANLTHFTKKREYFSADHCFILSNKIGEYILNDKMAFLLKDYTLLMIKPESFLLNKLQEIFSLLEKYHFSPVYYKFCTVSCIKSAELWKYHWSAATFIRIIVSQKLMSFSEGLILVLKNTNRNEEFASSYLCSLKGSAIEANRKAHHFRSILKPLNRLLNYIHTADEPIDFIRELGIFFDWDELFRVYQDIKDNTILDLQSILIESNSFIKNNEIINPYKVLERYKIWFTQKRNTIKQMDITTFNGILTKIDEVLNGKGFFDIKLLIDLQKLNLLEWNWDLLVIMTTFINYDSGEDPII